MNIPIHTNKTEKFSKGAKNELTSELSKIGNKICDEAARIAADECGDISKIEITSTIVNDASRYVTRRKIEKIKPKKWKEILPSLLYTLSGGAFSYGCNLELSEARTWIIVASVIVCTLAVIIQKTK